MKAIKIASGVAVSALALAISAQANAAAHEGGATETEWSFTGSMEAMFVMDLENDTKDVDLDEEDDFDSATAGEAWGLESTLSVVHGPFSGGITFTGDDESDVETSLEDIVITDGAISFGQVGSLVDATPAYVYDMDDSEDYNSDENVGNNALFAALGDLDEGADVGAGFRYTTGGLKVQLEGQNDYVVSENTGFGAGAADGFDADGEKTVTDYGLAASYSGEMDALAYVAEAQFRGSDESVDSADPYVYVGAGATYSMDMVTVSAGVNQYSVPDIDGGAAAVADGKKANVMEYGFAVTATPIEAATLYVKGVDVDAGNYFEDLLVVGADTAKYLFGATYTVDMIKVTGEYTLTTAEKSGDELMGRVDYTQGAIAAYGEMTLSNLDADTADAALIEAGVSYTQENGVKYAADWDLQAEGDEDDSNTPVNAAKNQFKLSAAYAF